MLFGICCSEKSTQIIERQILINGLIKQAEIEPKASFSQNEYNQWNLDSPSEPSNREVVILVDSCRGIIDTLGCTIEEALIIQVDQTYNKILPKFRQYQEKELLLYIKNIKESVVDYKQEISRFSQKLWRDKTRLRIDWLESDQRKALFRQTIIWDKFIYHTNELELFSTKLELHLSNRTRRLS